MQKNTYPFFNTTPDAVLSFLGCSFANSSSGLSSDPKNG
jgi:hypothetical protein